MRRFILAVGFVALVASVLSGASIASKPGSGLPVHPANLNFGNVEVGSSSQLSVTMTNNSEEFISFAEWLGFDEPSPFALAFSPDPGSDCLLVLLAPGDKCTFTTTFSPTTEGRFERTMMMSFFTGLGHGYGAVWDVTGKASVPKH